MASHFTDVRSLLKQFKELEQRINSFGQTLLAKQAAEPFKEQSMLFTSKGELVINYYLSRVLKDVRADKASNPFEVIKFTQEILPQFFECNLALASVYGVSSPLKAKEEYNNAIKYARTSQEKLRASLLYTDFLIRSNEYLVAVDFLNTLQVDFSNCMDIHFEKAKALACVNQFEDALAELEQIEQIGSTDRLLSKVISKRADIYRRKANAIDIRKTQEKLANLKTAFGFLEHATGDKIIVDHMVEILIEISYLYMDSDALSYLYDKLKIHIRRLRISKNFKGFAKAITEARSRKDTELLQKIATFTINIHEHVDLLQSDETMVYSLKDGYGFCKCKDRTGIYFSMAGLPADIEEGDILICTGIFESKNGPQLISPQRNGNIFNRISG